MRLRLHQTRLAFIRGVIDTLFGGGVYCVMSINIILEQRHAAKSADNIRCNDEKRELSSRCPLLIVAYAFNRYLPILSAVLMAT